MYDYSTVLEDLAYDPSFPKQFTGARQPLYITFREHYCFSPSMPVPLYNEEDSLKNGFLPLGCRITEVEVSSSHFCSMFTLFDTGRRFLLKGGVNITDETHSFDAFYETYRAEPIADEDVERYDQFSLDARFFGAVDIIITGEVCPCHIHSNV